MSDLDPHLRTMQASMEQYLTARWHEWFQWIRYERSQLDDWTSGEPVPPPPAEVNARCSEAVRQISQELQQTSSRPLTYSDVLREIERRLLQERALVWVDGHWYECRRPDVRTDTGASIVADQSVSMPASSTTSRLSRSQLMVIVGVVALIIVTIAVMFVSFGSDPIASSRPLPSETNVPSSSVSAGQTPPDRQLPAWSALVRDERTAGTTTVSTRYDPWIQVFDPTTGQWTRYSLRSVGSSWCLLDRHLERYTTGSTGRMVLILPTFGSDASDAVSPIIMPIRAASGESSVDGAFAWCDDPTTTWAYVYDADTDLRTWSSPLVFDLMWPPPGGNYRDPIVVDIVTDPRVQELSVRIGSSRYDGIRRPTDPQTDPEAIRWYVTLPPPAERDRWIDAPWMTVVIEDDRGSSPGMMIDTQALSVPESLIRPALSAELRISPVPVVGPPVCILKIRNDDSVPHRIDRSDIAVVFEDGTILYPMTDTSLTVNPGTDVFVRWIYRPTMKEVRFRDGITRWERIAPPASSPSPSP